jgi:hypothetical protein
MTVVVLSAAKDLFFEMNKQVLSPSAHDDSRSFASGS